MNWLLESPWPILIGGLGVELVLVVALVPHGRAALLAAISAVAVLTGVLVVVERMVVTETEQVEATLDELSAALVANELPAVLNFIAPSAADVRALAQSNLPQVKITDARIGGDLEVKVDERAVPHTALASFSGVFSFKLVRGASPYDKIVRRFRVKFVKQQDRWLITGVEESDFQKR